jgi:hypothetical protein
MDHQAQYPSKEYLVTGDSEFEKKVATLLRWKKRSRLFSSMVWALALSLILNAFALGFKKVFHWPENDLFIYLALTLIAFGLGLIFHLLPPKDLLLDLIEIDSRLQLKDRLSTSFEYWQSGRPSRFRERLLSDAGGVLDRLPRKKLYPPRFSVSYVLIPFFAFIIMGLLLFDFSPPQFKRETTPEGLARVAAEIKKFSKEKILEAIARNDQSLGEPYRQLEEMAKDLQNHSLKQEKLLLALGEMKKEALAERLRLTQKLEKELNAGGSPSQGNSFSLPQESATPQKLEKMTEQLKEFFDGSLPDSITKDISRIGEKFELEQFLEKTLSMAIPSEPGGDERLPGSKKDKAYVAKGETREELKRNPSGEAKAPLSPEKDPTRVPGSPKAGPGMEDNREAGKKSQHDKNDDPYTAGSSKGTGERLVPYELKGKKGPSFKEEGGPTNSDPRDSFQVRALPSFGKTKNNREEILQEIPARYWEEREAVLLKEKIPQEYREYIKHYFLSIRQEKGKKRDDKSY